MSSIIIRSCLDEIDRLEMRIKWLEQLLAVARHELGEVNRTLTEDCGLVDADFVAALEKTLPKVS